MMQALRYSGAGDVTSVSVPCAQFAGAVPNPPHSPVVVVESHPPTSMEEMQRRGVVPLPPSLCALLVCPPVLISTVSGAALSVAEWQRLCAEAEALVRRQLLYQGRTVVPLVGRSTGAAVTEELVKRGKKVGSRKVKVKEDVEVSEEEQDDAVLELLSDEDDEEEELALEDEEDVDDACDEQASGECEDEDEDGEGDEECSEEECSEGAEAVEPPPAKKPRGGA